MKIELTKAKDADKQFLLHLRKSTMADHLKAAGLFLSDNDHMDRVQFQFENAFIIVSGNQRLGLLKYLDQEKEMEILQLQILPVHQGKGIGKQVIDFLTLKGEKENKNLRLKVLKQNPARHLYERNGFTIVDKDDYEFYMLKPCKH